MGNIESKQRLGERVKASRNKLDIDKKSQLERLEYIKSKSPELSADIIKTIDTALKLHVPFSEETLLISWFIDSRKTEKIVIECCGLLFKQPIKKDECVWFNSYLLPSSVWFFKSTQHDAKREKIYLFDHLLDIANKYSMDIINEMDAIYKHLKSNEKWKDLIDIKNRNDIERQDDNNVGLLTDKSILNFRKELLSNNDEKDEKENESAKDLETFIDMHVASNILISMGNKINHEFQDYIKNLMGEYGDYQSGPTKTLDRVQSKLENDYSDELFPRCAKILDVVRCSVAFNTISQLINGYNHLMNHIKNNENKIQISRIKNGFLPNDDDLGGYRDIKMNVVFRSTGYDHDDDKPISMICEIQLLLVNYLWEKKKIHKLYSILRQKTFFQSVVNDNNYNNNNNAKIKGLESIFALTDYEKVRSATGGCVNSNHKILAVNNGGYDNDKTLFFYDLVTKKKLIEKKIWSQYACYCWCGSKYFAWQYNQNTINILVIKTHNNSNNPSFEEQKELRIEVASSDKITHFISDRNGINITIIVNEKILQQRSIMNSKKVIFQLTLDDLIKTSVDQRLCLSDNSNFLAIAPKKEYVYLIDCNKKVQHKLISKNNLMKTRSTCFVGGNEELLAVADCDGTIEIWDIKTRQSMHRIRASEQYVSVYSVGNVLASVGAANELKVFNTNNWDVLLTQQISIESWTITLSSDSRYLTISGYSGQVCIVYEIKYVK